MDYVESAGIRIARPLYDFVAAEALPGTSISADAFWSGFAGLLADLAPRCKALLGKRDSIQVQVDAWHIANKGKPADAEGYMRFLHDIGYLVEEPAKVAVRTANVDAEIATLAGPQLVVPVTNARYALNAANARWGSLYDALYGTDAIRPRLQ
jgi:malate synthase